MSGIAAEMNAIILNSMMWFALGPSYSTAWQSGQSCACWRGSQVTAQAGHVDQAASQQAENHDQAVHRPLPGIDARSMSATQALSPNLCFRGDSGFVYERGPILDAASPRERAGGLVPARTPPGRHSLIRHHMEPNRYHRFALLGGH